MAASYLNPWISSTRQILFPQNAEEKTEGHRANLSRATALCPEVQDFVHRVSTLNRHFFLPLLCHL